MTKPHTQRNVILICVDQWRGDCLSADGHPDVRTPFLDQIAGRGVRMSQAYSATPTCVPARMALLTGMSQGNHRRVAYQDGISFDIPDHKTLPGAFREHGYQTSAIGKMHYFPERARLGFDEVLLHDGYLHYLRHRERDVAWYDDYLPWLREQAGCSAVEDYIEHGAENNSMIARPWDKAERLHPTNWVVTQATQWFYRRDPRKPFFLYLSFHRPHSPYDPPAWAMDRYLSRELTMPRRGNWEENTLSRFEDPLNPAAHVSTIPEDELHRTLAGYYGSLTHIDFQISRLMQVLGEFDLLDSTTLCFVSDHGDMLGDHGMWRKGYPYEGSARVPLLFAGPGVPQRQTCDDIAELRDVMPTLLSLAGVPIPDTVDGRDLTQRWSGDAPWRDYLHGEHGVLGHSLQWIRWSHYSYVWWSGDGREQLFDLQTDPKQLTDLCISLGENTGEGGDAANRGDAAAHGDAVQSGDTAEYRRALETCRAMLITELTGREEGFVRDGQLVPGQPITSCLSTVHPPSPQAR